MDKFPLKNKNIVITGASSGIGKATALYLAREGANLILAARRELLLEEVAIECETFGVKAFPYKTDVTKLDEVRNLYEFALTELGSIDIWINNAGVGAFGSFTQTPIEVHEQVIRTNLMGYLYGAYVIIPYFKERQQGTLINNISLGAFVATPYAVAYSASKLGLRGYSEALRAELSEYKDIHVCDVFPTFVNTPGFIHAANFSEKSLKAPVPSLDPYKVARKMVNICRHPTPRSMVGNISGRFARVVQVLAPNLLGKVMAKIAKIHFKKVGDAPKTKGNLFHPVWKGAGTHGGLSLVLKKSPRS